MRLITLFLIIASVSFSVLGQSTKKDQKIAIRTYLIEQKSTNGGLEVKKELFDLKISELEKKYIGLVNNAETLEEFHGFEKKVSRKVLSVEEFEQLMIGMTAEFQDGHHNTMRKSMSHWDLGLKTAVIQGKLYVTGVNKLYASGRFGEPLRVGDEIISLNGESIDKLKKKNLLYTRMFSGTYEAQEIMALESLVSRSGRYLRSVNEGDSVSVAVKRGGNLLEGELVWVDASKVSNEIQFYAGLNPQAPKDFVPPPFYYGMMSQRSSHFRQGIESLGLPNGAIQEVGELVNMQMQAEVNKVPKVYRQNLPVSPVKRLQAYTVQGQGGKAGVIRIPSYSPNGFIEVMREFNWIAEVVDQMNNAGVTYFVIDANSNGGGYVAYVSHLMRLFATNGKDVKTGSANLRLTKTFLGMLYEAATEGMNVETLVDFGQEAINTVDNVVMMDELSKEIGQQINLKDYFNINRESFADKQQLKLLYERLVKKFKAGEKWSGQLPYMGTVNGINEGSSGRSPMTGNPIFEKPVIFLNDVRSASGGDYAPAILAANDKVLLMGDTSRGLGMPVFRNIPSLPGSEMYTRNPYAFSLLPNGLPLENVGPVPHIRREVFVNDLKNGFGNYAMDVLETGFLLSVGKTKKEISEHINKSVMEMLIGGDKSKLPKDVQEVVKSALELEEKVSVISKSKDREKAAKKFRKIYAEFNVLLKMAEEEGLATFGTILEVALPADLLSQDIMLASVYRARSVVDRLEMLGTHSKYKNMPETKKLFKTLIETFSILENVATTNTCETPYMVKKSGSFKTK